MVVSNMGRRLVVLVICLTSISNSWAAASPSVDPNIAKIDALAKKLTLQDFEGDPLFEQKLGKSTSESQYHLLQNKVPKPLPTFNSPAGDIGKDQVVLPHDHTEKHNKTYIVLRKKADANYYATYVYARDKGVYEFDNFDVDRALKETLVDCESSVIAACGYNTTINVETKHQFRDPKSSSPEEIPPLTPIDGFSLANGFIDDLDISEISRRNMKGRGLGLNLNLDVVNVGVNMNTAIKIDINLKKKRTSADAEDNQEDTEDVHMLVTKKKKSTGEIRQEYLPCKGSTCTGKLFKKVCTNGVCEMKELQKNVNLNIYKLVWINVKIKVSDGTQIKQKIKKYSVAKVFTSPCGGPPRCEKYKRAWANDRFSRNPILFILQRVKQPGQGSGGKIIEETVTRYVLLDTPGLASLYKKECKPVKGKEDFCSMVPLIDPNAPLEGPPTEVNGEYVLFIIIKKPATTTTKATKEYKLAPITSKGNWFTKLCLKEKCSWQAVGTKPGYTFYKIIKIRRKLKLSNGTILQEDVLRFDAVPAGTNAQLYVKTCYPDKCVLKPYVDDEVKNKIKFYKMVIQIRRPKGSNSTANEKRTNKFLPLNVYKQVCKETTGACVFQLANCPEDVSSYPVFESSPNTTASGDQEYIAISPAGKRQLYYEFCSTTGKDTKCGMVPAVDEGQTKRLYRLVAGKKKTTLPNGTVVDEDTQDYLPTIVYLLKRAQCDNATSTCNLDLLTSFDNGVLKDRTKLYNIVTRTKRVKQPTGDEDVSYNEFTPLDPDEAYFEKDCSAPDKSCVYRNIDLDSKNTIYNKTIGPDGKPDFVPLQLYGRLCTDQKHCEMIPLKGDKEELQKFHPVYILRISKSVTKLPDGSTKTTTIKRFLPLPNAVRDTLYRKVCDKDGSNCVMRPLKEENPNTFYLLTSQPGSPVEEYAPVSLFKQICAAAEVCKLEPLLQGEDARKYPLFQLKPKPEGSPAGGPREYLPITPDMEDKLFAKVCTNNKCIMKPIFQNEIYRAEPDTSTNPPGKKFVPAKIFKKVCEGTTCHMETLLASDDPNKFPLFELGTDASPDKANYNFHSLPADERDDLFKKTCTGEKCTFEPLFNEEHSIVKLQPPKPKPTPPAAVLAEMGIKLKTTPDVKPSDITPMKIYKKICDENHDNCQLFPLNNTDDPRQFELYEMRISNKTDPDGVKHTTRTFAPLLTELIPVLFRKDCIDHVCTLTPLFPEDEHTVYKFLVPVNPAEGTSKISSMTREKYRIALVFKKICPPTPPPKGDGCRMEQLMATDNAKDFQVFEQITEDKGKKGPNGEPSDQIVRYYQPITPQLDGRDYFRKLCTAKKSCRMKPLFDDQDTIYRQMTVVNPKKTPEEKSNRYTIVNIYKKNPNCVAGSKDCDFVPMTPADDFTVPIFEMTMIPKLDPTTKQPTNTTIKNYSPLPKEAVYELFYKQCSDTNVCIYLPIVEDPNSFYKLEVPRQNPMSKDPPKKRFVPTRLFKKTCTDKGVCTVERIKPNETFPDQAYEEVYVDKAKPGEPPNLTKVYNALPEDEIAKTYKKVCDDGSVKCMIPVRPNNLYKLQNIRRKIKHADGTIETVDATEFVPIGIFKRECSKTKTCEMVPFNSSENPRGKQLFELSILKSTDKNTGAVTTIKRFLPVTPDLMVKLYKRKCSNETGECSLVPLIEPEIFIRTVIKKVNQLPQGELEEERIEEMKPISAYKHRCRGQTGPGQNKTCEMVLVTASDKLQPEDIYELAPPNKKSTLRVFNNIGANDPSPSNDLVLVKNYYPMDLEKTDRLYKLVCQQKKDMSNCTIEPMFPKLYYKWKIILKKKKLPDGKVIVETYKDQVPIHLFTKACQQDVCTYTELKGDPDDSKKSPLFILVAKRKPKKAPEVGDEVVKTYTEVPLSDYEQIHTRVCNKDGLCIPKPFTENAMVIQPIYKIIRKEKINKQPDGTTVRVPLTEFAPTKLFKRVCDQTSKECVMKRFPPEEVLSAGNTPVYMWVILLRKRKSIDGEETEERVNKYITLKPEIAKNLYFKTCQAQAQCKMEPLQPDDGIIYKVLGAPENGVQKFTPVKLFKLKCKDGTVPKPPPSTNPDCVLQPAKKEAVADKSSPVFILVVTRRNNKPEQQLVPLTAEDIKDLRFKPCKNDSKCQLVPIVSPIDASLNAEPIDPSVDFAEVPSDSSLEVDVMPEKAPVDEVDIIMNNVPKQPIDNSLAGATELPETPMEFVISEEFRPVPVVTTTSPPVVEVENGEEPAEVDAGMMEEAPVRRSEPPIKFEEPVAITEANADKYIDIPTQTPSEPDVQVEVTKPPIEESNVQAITETNTESTFVQPATVRAPQKPIVQEVTRPTEHSMVDVPTTPSSTKEIDPENTEEFLILTEPPPDEAKAQQVVITTPAIPEEMADEGADPFGDEQKVLPPAPQISFQITETPVLEPPTSPKPEMRILGEIVAETAAPTTTAEPLLQAAESVAEVAATHAPTTTTTLAAAQIATETITEALHFQEAAPIPIEEPQFEEPPPPPPPPEPKPEATETELLSVSNTRPKAKPQPVLGVSFQTPDDKVVTFMIHPDVKNPGAPMLVFELVFEIEDERNVTIKLPPVAIGQQPSPNSLKLVYTPDDNSEDSISTYIIPEVPYDIKSNLKSITYDTPIGTVVFDFPDPADETRDGIIIYLTSKPAGKKYKYELPGMNALGFKELQAAKPKQKKLEIIFRTVDKKQVSIITAGEPTDPSMPYIVLTISFELPGSTKKVAISMQTKQGTKPNLELVNTNRGDNTVYEFPGVPAVDPRDGAVKITFKTAAGTVVFDIPSQTNEFRSGVILILRQLDGSEEPYELSGVKLKGTTDKPKLVKTLITFQTIDDREITMLTTSSPASNVYQIVSAIFDVEGVNATIQLATKPKGTGKPPAWLPLRYTSLENEVMNFEIPGIASDGIGNERRFTFTTSVGSLSLMIPSITSKVPSAGLEFTLTSKTGKKSKYKLCRFVQVINGEDSYQAGRGISDRKKSGRALPRSMKSGRTVTTGEIPANSANLLFFHPGWKLQYKTAKPKAIQENEDIFYGLGNCPYKKVSTKDLEGGKGSIPKLIQFYMTVMRTDCLTDKVNYMMALTTEGYLKLASSGLHFEVPGGLKQKTKTKLALKEAQKLSSAFEFAALTNIYNEASAKPPKKPDTPGRKDVSPSVRFLTELSMQFVKNALAEAPLHFVRLTRAVVGTLKTGFNKLAEDDLDLQYCVACKEDSAINFNDRIQVMSLMQFLIHGLEPVEQGKLKPREAFEKFYTLNEKAIEARVKAY